MLGFADFAAHISNLRSRWTGSRPTGSRPTGPLSIGIAGRLILSFTAVAVLAAAANLIVEHGVAVIRTQHVEHPRALPPPETVAPLAAPAAAPSPIERSAPQIEVPAFDPTPLLAAIERYQRAVEVRVAMDSAPAAAESAAAASSLDQATQSALLPPLVQRTAATYQATGNNYVRLSDARRAVLKEYAEGADAMDKRLSGALDGALKIFGRVLARQSLMQMRSELADVRRGFARLTAPDEDAAASLAAIVAGEAIFETNFKRNETGFVRSEGAPWVDAMSRDFSRLIELRKSIVDLDPQSHEMEAQLTKARGRLTAAIPKARARHFLAPAATAKPVAARAKRTPSPVAAPAETAETAAPIVAPAETAAPVAPITARAAPALAPIAAPVVARPAPAAAPPATASTAPEIETITTTTIAADAHERRVVAWITAVVLIVLLAISVSTVYSMLTPVKRMLKAYERIAKGYTDVRVPVGGLKELDALSIGFNRMAEQLAAARDMTRDYQQRLEEKVEQRTRQLQHLAEHDPLTHLPNRRQLFVLLNHALERAAQNGRHVAVFFLDIDNFKNLNDSMGHAFGDQVLAGIAQRLKEAAQSFGFAGRLGGDEFTVVLEDAAATDAVHEAGRQLVEIFSIPFQIDGRDVVVRASIGASVYPDHGKRAEDLLSAADAALFHAKALGRSRLAVFTPELLEMASRKFSIEQGLRRAIEHDEFELVFQPEVSLDSFNMVLVESLIRWRLPDGRQAPPGEFLSITEESGLIIEVGRWVLRKAIETAAKWHHGEWPEARVAINVSPRQFADPGFAEHVLALLAEFRLPPRCIELELTESVLQTGPATIESLRHLKSHDIAIALDDFGTGYSSLASLENLPLSRIKLDRSLIASIDSNPRAAAIAGAIISLCKGLGLEMTAEGVERPEQFAVLNGYRTITLQGYLISRPICAEAVIEAQRTIPRIMQDLLLSLPMTEGARPASASTAARALASGAASG